MQNLFTRAIIAHQTVQEAARLAAQCEADRVESEAKVATIEAVFTVLGIDLDLENLTPNYDEKDVLYRVSFKIDRLWFRYHPSIKTFYVVDAQDNLFPFSKLAELGAALSLWNFNYLRTETGANDE
jgi:hypothetical protein